MVDLVKIRQKAKEKKAADEAERLATLATPVEPDGNATAKPKRAGPKKGRQPNEADAPAGDSRAEQAVKAPVQPEETGAAEPSIPKTSASGKPAKGDATKAAAATEPPNPEPEASSGDEAASAAPAEPPEVDDAGLDRLARFKREAGKRRQWGGGTARMTASEDEESKREIELLRFRLAGEEYAVDIEKIVEIVPPRATTRVPNADPSIIGIMSLRGTIVTVFDLRRRLGHPPSGNGQSTDRRLIVLEREGETAGFLVDRVSRVVKLDPGELESHPVVSAAEQSDYVGGVFQAPDGLVILLDLERILASQG